MVVVGGGLVVVECEEDVIKLMEREKLMRVVEGEVYVGRVGWQRWNGMKVTGESAGRGA
jgi:hypothetical protein